MNLEESRERVSGSIISGVTHHFSFQARGMTDHKQAGVSNAKERVCVLHEIFLHFIQESLCALGWNLHKRDPRYMCSLKPHGSESMTAIHPSLPSRAFSELFL